MCIVDPDAAALERTKNEIYPKRYGEWDSEIKLYNLGEEPKGFRRDVPIVEFESSFQSAAGQAGSA